MSQSLRSRPFLFAILIAAIVAFALAVSASQSPHRAFASLMASIGSGSCSTGTTPCDNNTGVIGTNSCNGDDACDNNSGTIGNNSCDYNSACPDNAGTIGDNSCLDGGSGGGNVCSSNVDTIGSNSCTGNYSCDQNSGTIGDNSCLAGSDACPGNTGTVGDGSCLSTDACTSNHGEIGDASCVGLSCQSNSGTIRDDSCQGTDACDHNAGDIGSGSCQGSNACADNLGTIGDGSCVGSSACSSNTGSIGAGSCNSGTACSSNDGDIGNYSCNNQTQVCQDNTATIGDCEFNDPEILQCLPHGTLEVRKRVLPTFDAGRFDLLIDSSTYASSVGSGGTTGAVLVTPANHAVSEAGAGGTKLSQYYASVACRANGGAGKVVAVSLLSGSVMVHVNNGDAIVCTITNTGLSGQSLGNWLIGLLGSGQH